MNTTRDTAGALRAVMAIAAVLLLGLTLAACGSGGDSGGESADTAATQGGGGHESMEMTQLASSSAGGEEIGLSAMPPEVFYVPDGEGMRKQAPGAEDNAHMMVTVADPHTGVRLPGAAVSLAIEDPSGERVFDGPLYEMIGMGMGLHYGENVPLGKPGSYTATVVVGPPQVARHANLRDAWSKPERVEQSFRWDGEAVMGDR